MLTVTMVRKADYSGYRLFITPEMEGYPTDENQAAAYMNKIIERDHARTGQYLWITVALKRARWENRRCTFNKLLLLFPSSNRP